MITPAFFTSSLLHKPEGLLLRGGAWRKTVPLRVRVGYFYHPKLGHTLIDTGYSAHVTERGKTRDALLGLYRNFIRPSIVNVNPLAQGLARFGITLAQIETVILTHFHADHVGGLLDVPNARVICSKAGWQAFRKKSRLKNAMSGVFASVVPHDIEEKLTFVDDMPLVDLPYGLGAGRDFTGQGDLFNVDLHGHLEGHVGVLFPMLAQPFLYAADTQWLLQALLEDRSPDFPARLIQHDAKAAERCAARVRQFALQGGDVMLCHDPALHPFDVDPEVC